MMKYFLGIMVWCKVFNAFASLNIENMNFTGVITQETRIFNNDHIKETEDHNFAITARPKIEFNLNDLNYRGEFLARGDFFDQERNVIFVVENYFLKELNQNYLTVGHKQFTWSVMEGFKTSDFINALNLDGDLINNEKRGELTLEFEHLFDRGSVAFYFFPQYTSPYFAGSSSRVAPKVNNAAIDNAGLGDAVWVEGTNTIGDSWGLQGGFKLNFNFEQLDLSIYSFQVMDRQQPFIALSQDLTLRPHYFRVNQTGFIAQKTTEGSAFKADIAFRDFESTSFQPTTFFEPITPRDHTIMTLGVEHNLQMIEGYSTLLFLEYQKIFGLDQNSTQQFVLFQHDFFIGLRHDFNDIASRQLSIGVIYDLDVSSEYLISGYYSQRIWETWVINTGFRLVQARNSSQPSGLALFQESDHVFAKLDFFF